MESSLSRAFLEWFRRVKTERTIKYPSHNCTIAALAKIIQDSMPVVNMIAACHVFSPFGDVHALQMRPHGAIYDYDQSVNLEVKRKLFESVLEPMPSNIASTPMPLDMVRYCEERKRKAPKPIA